MKSFDIAFRNMSYQTMSSSSKAYPNERIERKSEMAQSTNNDEELLNDIEAATKRIFHQVVNVMMNENHPWIVFGIRKIL